MFRCTFSVSVLCATQLLLSGSAGAADPCAQQLSRALVLGSGGSKGAFEAGAVYHLVVHRGCDFSEISGSSIGAVNGALLAQAAADSDAARSLENMRSSAENLIAQWSSIERPKQVMRSRPVGKIRFALFGLESIKDFEPLRQFINDRVSLDELRKGRELRISTMTFNDGRYREIVINPQGRVDSATAHDYIYGSAIVPVFGEMPLISPPTNTPEMPLQFGDGGVRHQTPVTSYFQRCDPAADAATPPRCQPLTGNDTPRHPRTQQLFVVVTSPFSRRNDVRPVFAAKGVDPRTGQVTDGRQILVRMFDLFLDTMYRDDLDDMLLFNDLLRWQSQSAGSNPLTPFPIASFNRASSPDAATLPYDIAIIAPQREDSDPMTIFKVEPETMRRQLYCGCVAADDIMQTQFGLATLADRCAVRFPAMTPIDGVNDWPPGICGNSGLQP